MLAIIQIRNTDLDEIPSLKILRIGIIRNTYSVPLAPPWAKE
jgi:hypothetical protein